MSKSNDNDKKDDIEKEVDYESEWRNICEKANKWVVSKQLSKEELEELDSACDHLRLRRLDKSLWISAFIVTYFKIVLVEYESEWRKACDRASAWISEQVHNSDLEKELYSTCEQYLIQQGCEFLNSKNTTIVTEVLNKPSQSVIYGSDGRAVTQKDHYLNSELIVAGAAARAKCKVELERAQNKTLEYVSKATDLALKYTEDEVNRLFDNNVTHGNKDDVLNRAKRATKFLMDEYYKSDNNDRDDTFNEEEDSRYMTQTYNFSLDDLKEAYRSRSLDIS
ncbi:hypothetical protein RhiirA1_389181 [Rhizophagus irregularis]|uniref:Uncharacterized protein n=1 Tax=Rhizophagus irregularis TaxID=588596 RepID=A0A2N0SC39_9GLOM|nr:hypothetical protein RhiirA1_389181 [Rhizophagus irregularis]